MGDKFRCTLPSFHEFHTKDDDIVTQSFEEQVNVNLVITFLATECSMILSKSDIAVHN